MGAERWQNNWRVVAPAGATRFELPRWPQRLSMLTSEIRRLPSGAPVVLVASAPGAIGRCRRFAAANGLAVESEYLAFPSAAAPAFLVEDDPAPVRLFFRNIVPAPPHRGVVSATAAAVAVLRRLHPWRLVRSLAPGRIVVGRRQ